MRSIALVAILGACFASTSMAAVRPVSSVVDFRSLDQEVLNFDRSTAPSITLDTTVYIGTARTWSDGVTTSGRRVGVEDVGNRRLGAEFSRDAYEVGMFFGNDDFGRIFDVTLAAFDISGDLIGRVVVASNANDYVDQFIGLRSRTAIRSIKLGYERPKAGQLSVVIDDLRVGFDEPRSKAVPEPGTLAIWGFLGLCGIGATRFRRKKQTAE